MNHLAIGKLFFFSSPSEGGDGILSAMKTRTIILLLLCALAGFAIAQFVRPSQTPPSAGNQPPPPASESDGVDDLKGRTFTWEAGGKEGITLDVLIKATPQGHYHFIEKATLTIDKDGRILKVEGKRERTRIRS